MEYALKSVSCPLCGSESSEPLVPGRKMSEEVGYWQERRDIWVSLCTHCGAVFENPQVDVLESRDYNDVHYYNKWFNDAAAHDRLQNTYAPFRWDALADRIDWSTVRTALDVGATGAWSAVLKQQQPHIKSMLIEPSRAAVDFCRQRYPDVVPILGILEELDSGTEPLDLVTLWYSLYHISDPVNALRKCRERMAEGGRLVVCISHGHLEVDVWGSNRTTRWVDMAHVVRGVMLTIFSRKVLSETLRLAGFREVERFTAEHVADGEWKGRQDYFVIAEKTGAADGAMVAAADPVEVAWARDNIRNHCVNASSLSLRSFLANRPVREAALVCDDDVYAGWAMSLLGAHNLRARRFRGTDEDMKSLRTYLSGDGRVAFNATWKPLQIAGLAPHLVVDCLQGTQVAGDYGLWTRDHGGDVLVTKAFLPDRDYPSAPPH